MLRTLKSRQIHKTLFLEFKVVRRYRCWYPRTVRQQCLLCYVFTSPGLESVPGRDRQTTRQTDGRTDRQNYDS